MFLEEERRGNRTRMESDAKGMYEEGLTLEVIARIQKTSVETVKKMLGLQMA